MKKLISNKTQEALEIAKRILYSLKVIAIGLLIPFLFIYGITKNTPTQTSKDEINCSRQQQVPNDRVTVDFNKPLFSQNA